MVIFGFGLANVVVQAAVSSEIEADLRMREGVVIASSILRAAPPPPGELRANLPRAWLRVIDGWREAGLPVP